MYKRTHKSNSFEKPLDDTVRLKRTDNNPIKQVINTLPQLAISFAILCFSYITHEFNLYSQGILFYISLFAGFIVCSIFCILQFKGTEFVNWENDPVTRQYIQIATVSTLVSFIGLNTSLWSIFGILTPVVIVSLFVHILSIFTILLAFIK